MNDRYTEAVTRLSELIPKKPVQGLIRRQLNDIKKCNDPLPVGFLGGKAQLASDPHRQEIMEIVVREANEKLVSTWLRDCVGCAFQKQQFVGDIELRESLFPCEPPPKHAQVPPDFRWDDYLASRMCGFFPNHILARLHYALFRVSFLTNWDRLRRVDPEKMYTVISGRLLLERTVDNTARILSIDSWLPVNS